MLYSTFIAVFGSILISGISAAATEGRIDQDDQNAIPSTRKVQIDGSSLGGFVLPILPLA